MTIKWKLTLIVFKNYKIPIDFTNTLKANWPLIKENSSKDQNNVKD